MEASAFGGMFVFFGWLAVVAFVSGRHAQNRIPKSNSIARVTECVHFHEEHRPNAPLGATQEKKKVTPPSKRNACEGDTASDSIRFAGDMYYVYIYGAGLRLGVAFLLRY